MFHRNKLVAMAVLTVCAANPAFAQNLDPLTSVFETVAEELTGPLAIAVGTIAVVGAGFLCFMGRLNWGWFAAVFVGLALIFSAATIVTGFAGAS